jgi:hypothetical protein
MIKAAFGNGGFFTDIIDGDRPVAVFPDEVVGHFEQSKFGVSIRHRKKVVD